MKKKRKRPYCEKIQALTLPKVTTPSKLLDWLWGRNKPWKNARIKGIKAALAADRVRQSSSSLSLETDQIFEQVPVNDVTLTSSVPSLPAQSTGELASSWPSLLFNLMYCVSVLNTLQRSMTITYNTVLLRDAVNRLSISVRVTERG
ncbi:hypothetical protein INR49_002521 [Caranx melampygus]|nr:hypothetical protein INR49_002521 [Caranx melampygus]